MGKKLLIVLVILLSLILTFPVNAATPAPGGPFSSSFRVQNLGSSSVKCAAGFFDGSGYAIASASIGNIAPGDSWFIFVPNINDKDLDVGRYSSVVTCSGAVAISSNFSDSDSAASYNVLNWPAQTWYIPTIYDNYYNYYSNVVAQNTTGSPVNITLHIYSGGSEIFSQSESNVAPYKSVTFEQEGIADYLLAPNQYYSGRITATGNVAAEVNIYGKDSSNNQLFSYTPFPTGGRTMYAPVVMKNYYGFNSALVIQNIGGTSTYVTVTYSTGHLQGQWLSPNAAWSIYVPTQGPSGLPSGNTYGQFSATVTSTDADITLNVNSSNSYNRASTYTGAPAGSRIVLEPTVMKRYFNYNSSVTCQVISGGPRSLRIEYFEGGVSKGYIDSPTINNGQSVIFYQPNASFLPDNWIGSAKVTSEAYVACVVSQDMNEGSYATTFMDQLLTYEGMFP